MKYRFVWMSCGMLIIISKFSYLINKKKCCFCFVYFVKIYKLNILLLRYICWKIIINLYKNFDLIDSLWYLRVLIWFYFKECW